MKFLLIIKNHFFYVFVIFIFIIISTLKFYPNIFNLIVLKNFLNSQNLTNIKSQNQNVLSSVANKSEEIKNQTNTLKVEQQDSNKSNLENNPKETIFVDLSGAVNNPGVYELSANSRVKDVLTLGKGFTNEASSLWISRNLNLAKPLKDTQKIYVPFKWETYGDCTCLIDSLYVDAPLLENYSSNNSSYLTNYEIPVTVNTSPSALTTSSTNPSTLVSSTSITSNVGSTSLSNLVNLINVNTANAQKLDELPGIGETYAQKIIDNRPYANFSDFKTKSQIPSSTADNLVNLITF